MLEMHIWLLAFFGTLAGMFATRAESAGSFLFYSVFFAFCVASIVIHI